VWLYEGKEYTPSEDELKLWAGFIYEIKDNTNDKLYIGKKNFWSKRRLPPLKGKTRKRLKVAESDWMKYYGSNEEVKLLLENDGPERFSREILRLCETKGLMSYFEAKEQFDREVLFRDDYYNEFIGCKIHSNHVRKKDKKMNNIVEFPIISELDKQYLELEKQAEEIEKQKKAILKLKNKKSKK